MNIFEKVKSNVVLNKEEITNLTFETFNNTIEEIDDLLEEYSQDIAVVSTGKIIVDITNLDCYRQTSDSGSYSSFYSKETIDNITDYYTNLGFSVVHEMALSEPIYRYTLFEESDTKAANKLLDVIRDLMETKCNKPLSSYGDIALDYDVDIDTLLKDVVIELHFDLENMTK